MVRNPSSLRFLLRDLHRGVTGSSHRSTRWKCIAYSFAKYYRMRQHIVIVGKGINNLTWMPETATWTLNWHLHPPLPSPCAAGKVVPVTHASGCRSDHNISDGTSGLFQISLRLAWSHRISSYYFITLRSVLPALNVFLILQLALIWMNCSKNGDFSVESEQALSLMGQCLSSSLGDMEALQVDELRCFSPSKPLRLINVKFELFACFM